MDINDQTFIVTEGASGLGETTVGALHERGAHVTNPDQVAHAVQVAAQQPGPLAGVVNCAGIGIAKTVIGKDGPPPPDDFLRVLNTNLAAASRERGVIINTASAAAFDGRMGQAAHAASKGGVVSMTLPIARELTRDGIRLVTIAPGLFLTPMMGTLPAAARDSLGGQVPFPSRLGEPSEYAALALHIVENQMIKGEVVRRDGALRMAAK
ncbi:SDR family NAD(P)-dependent oxidoreductase [Arthrobacter sp. LAPM80]|uniref:SDR family NAD(P)-dependent oxidoreductase n=1 Tax=Arthrobacter sp. LAPM80 TaxID=3141788 RepID=UPI00398B83DD